MRIKTLCAGVLMGVSICGLAQPEGTAPVPDPPAPPEKVQSGEVLEPEVRIIEGKRQTVTEYRVNGALRAVKVEPKNAPAYYLVDADGDGALETRTNELGADFWIPQWVIFSW